MTIQGHPKTCSAIAKEPTQVYRGESLLMTAFLELEGQPVNPLEWEICWYAARGFQTRSWMFHESFETGGIDYNSETGLAKVHLSPEKTTLAFPGTYFSQFVIREKNPKDGESPRVKVLHTDSFELLSGPWTAYNETADGLGLARESLTPSQPLPIDITKR